jgi:hypothetical protein
MLENFAKAKALTLPWVYDDQGAVAVRLDL